MLKNILNLEGTEELTKKVQKTIQGSIKIPSCLAPIQLCKDGREYDVCMPISRSNYPCN